MRYTIFCLESGRRHLVIGTDNVPLHVLRKSQILCRPNSHRLSRHRPYSPDLTLSDFCRFDCLNYYLNGHFYVLEKTFLLEFTQIRREMNWLTELPRSGSRLRN
jgi:hypothetical protein